MSEFLEKNCHELLLFFDVNSCEVPFMCRKTPFFKDGWSLSLWQMGR